MKNTIKYTYVLVLILTVCSCAMLTACSVTGGNNSEHSTYTEACVSESTSDLFAFSAGPSLFGYMDRDGNIVIEPSYTYAWQFSEGLAAVEVTDGKAYASTVATSISNKRP